MTKSNRNRKNRKPQRHSRDWFVEEMARLQRRMEKLAAVEAGKLRVKYITIEEHQVPEYTMPTHQRMIVLKPEQVSKKAIKKAALRVLQGGRS